MGVDGAEPPSADAAVESCGRIAGLIHLGNGLTRPLEVPGFCLIHLLQHGPSSCGQYTPASRRGMPEVSSRSCREFCGAYFVSRITPIPTFLRSRSVYFSRAFSAASFVLNGFDNGVNSPSTYLKSSHCSMILGMGFLSAIGPLLVNTLQDERRLIDGLVHKTLLGEIRLLRLHRFDQLSGA
jgi:hypothetical protein